MQKEAFCKATEYRATHRCSSCQSALGIDFESGEYGIYCIRHSKEHTDFEHIPEPKTPSYSELYDAGEAIPGHIAQQIERRRRQDMETEYGQETSRELQPYSRSTSLTEEQAKHIITTVWPKAPLVEVMKAAILCKDYGLNPLMKHLFLIPFKAKAGGIDWVTVLGINATRTLARRVNPFGYEDGPRIMTDGEQERVFGKVDGQIWAITVLIDRHGFKAPGYGSWPARTAAYGAEKGNTPQNMAMIRSERAALNRLCPAEMSGAIADVEVMDERHIELVQEPQPPPPKTEPPKPAPKPQQLIQPPEKPQASNEQAILFKIKAESERLGIDPREAYNNRFPDTLPTLADIQAYLQELKETPIDEGVPQEVTNWTQFWIEAKRITGKTEGEIPGMLGLRNMDDWTGTLDEALEELKK